MSSPANVPTQQPIPTVFPSSRQPSSSSTVQPPRESRASQSSSRKDRGFFSKDFRIGGSLPQDENVHPRHPEIITSRPSDVDDPVAGLGPNDQEARVPPTPPPKSPTYVPGSTLAPPPASRGPFGFVQKPSFPGFSIRQGSTTSLLRPRQQSDATVAASADPKRRSVDDASLESPSRRHFLSSQVYSAQPGAHHSGEETRKGKNPVSIMNRIRRKSKSRLRAESTMANDTHPPLPENVPPNASPPAPSTSSLNLPAFMRSKKARKSKKGKEVDRGYSESPRDEFQVQLQTDLDQMDGIVDWSRAGRDGLVRLQPSAPNGAPNGAAEAPSESAAVLNRLDFHPEVAQAQRTDSNTITPRESEIDQQVDLHSEAPDFHDPFQPNPAFHKRRGIQYPYGDDLRKVSPKTPLPALLQGFNPNYLPPSGRPSWTPPDSWEVEKVEGDVVDEMGESSSDESQEPPGLLDARGAKHSHGTLHLHGSPNELSGVKVHDSRRDSDHSVFVVSHSDSCSTVRMGSAGPHNHARKNKVKKVEWKKSFKIRIYRQESEYHVVEIDQGVEVQQLVDGLKKKNMAVNEMETHRLYIKERDRVRVLGGKEKPADIVRKILEQAGYEPSDILDWAGHENLSYLYKIDFKSQLLGGPQDEEVTLNAYEYVDLSGRNLRAIPIVLHKHADKIISLKLSRNPMLEVPLDFIQSCSSLRELRLSSMAMKRIPQSLRHSRTINRLDLSSNRIHELDDGLLDQLVQLKFLWIHNNRIERLSWYFPRMHLLVNINLSNNKFHRFPDVLCKVTSLAEVDISFNFIPELPETIGELINLERLTIVANQIKQLPAQFDGLTNLKQFDCRWNHIADLSLATNLPKIQEIKADYNVVSSLELQIGPSLKTIQATENDITKLSLVLPQEVDNPPKFSLTTLDISHAKLSSIDDFPLGRLISLRHLKLNHNSLRLIPPSLGDLSLLESLDCSNNKLIELPASIGRLQKLNILDAHNNSLKELPCTLWFCASLSFINATSNLLEIWHNPPLASSVDLSMTDNGTVSTQSAGVNGLGFSAHNISYPQSIAQFQSQHMLGPGPERKSSLGSLGGNSNRQVMGRSPFLPPLANSLEKLYLGENRLTEDVIRPLAILRELRVLNLSFNDLQEIAHGFFFNLTNLEELYLSGNKLAGMPMEHFPKMLKLQVLYLNANRFQTLPHELAKVPALRVVDVGSNQLKYNINNWEFDWNWNFNKNLRYLNLSGNKRLEIKQEGKNGRQSREQARGAQPPRSLPSLAGFTDLSQIRVLGLMDVTLINEVDLPEENEDRRVRLSSSMVNGMGYGIADTLGRSDTLAMMDMVHEYPIEREGEALVAMFGRPSPPNKHTPSFGYQTTQNRMVKYIKDQFVTSFETKKSAMRKDETIADVLRRTFMSLNMYMHDQINHHHPAARKLSQISGGASSLPGPSGRGSAANHQPPIGPASNKAADPPLAGDVAALRTGVVGQVLYFDNKKRQMWAANVGDVLAVVSRQGGAYLVSTKHHPFDTDEIARVRSAEGWISPGGLVNEEVDITRAFGFYHLAPVIVARPSITRWDLNELDEFVIIANRGLWDHVSYQTAVDIARRDRNDPMIAAQKLRDFAISYGAEESTMIMVIGVQDLFNRGRSQYEEMFLSPVRIKRSIPINDRELGRLDGEISPPTGHVALVFTDIRNSTHLWEVNPGMPMALKLHHNLLRRQLRICGGYEAKTEGDAFMCSFQTVMEAVWFCLSVQVQLLYEQWPLEILECADGKAIFDLNNNLIAKGLSVRMGIHCGTPMCERDLVTDRMDYYGPMVNRSARINGSAAGGQIMCSGDVIREIEASVYKGDPTPYTSIQPSAAIENVRAMGPAVTFVGETKLKGLENPEMLSAIYPNSLANRHGLDMEAEMTKAVEGTNSSRVTFSAAQIKDLGSLCLRLEALASGRVFRPLPLDRKGSMVSANGSPENAPSLPSRSATLQLPGQDKSKDRRHSAVPSTIAILERKTAENEKEKEREMKMAAMEAMKNAGEEEEEEDLDLDLDPEQDDSIYYGDLSVLLPPINDKWTDTDLMMLMDSLSVRIANAVSTLLGASVHADAAMRLGDIKSKLMRLQEAGEDGKTPFDGRILEMVLEALGV